MFFSDYFLVFMMAPFIREVNAYFALQAISASSSEVPSVLEFLQRRKLEAHKVVAFFT